MIREISVRICYICDVVQGDACRVCGIGRGVIFLNRADKMIREISVRICYICDVVRRDRVRVKVRGSVRRVGDGCVRLARMEYILAPD